MKQCQNCGKGSKMVGHRIKLRGNYNPTNWSRKYPNLQKAVNKEGVKISACVQCIRTFAKKPKAVKTRKVAEPVAAAAK